MAQTKIHPISDRQSHMLALGLIFLTVLFSFGLSVSTLGLYGDQWAVILESLPVGSGITLERVIQQILITMYGKMVILYHLTNLFLWTLAGYLFFRTQTRAGIHIDRALAGSLLFVVFPAFLYPASAFELSPALAGLCLIFASTNLFIDALSKTKITIWKLISGMVCAILAILSSPVVTVMGACLALMIILYWIIWHKKQKKLVYVLALSWLVVSLLLLFLNSAPETPGLSVATESLKQWISSFLLSWRQIIATPDSGGKTALYLAILMMAVVLLWYSLLKIKISGRKSAGIEGMSICNTLLTVFVIGGTGLVFFLLSSLFITKPDSRYGIETTQAAAGILAALLVTETIELLFMEKYHTFILAVLIVFSAGTRYQMIDRYGVETTKVNDFIRQLYIRVDDFKTGTRLVVEQLPFDYTSRKSLQALISDQYLPKANPEALSVIPADDEGFREFMENTSASSTTLRIDEEEIFISKDSILAVWQPVGRCVEFIDDSAEKEELPQGLSLAADYSNPSLILAEDGTSTSGIEESNTSVTDTWCNYLQHANRLAQNAQWDEVEIIYKYASDNNIVSQNQKDYATLLTSLIHQGKIDDALSLFQNLNTNPDIQNYLCKKWTKTLTDSTIAKEVVEEARKAQSTLECE